MTDSLDKTKSSEKRAKELQDLLNVSNENKMYVYTFNTVIEYTMY